MPRDKTVSHERIVKAARKEFLENGFEKASMKAVADAVGMTSAALYRHFQNKQDMFKALVQPAIDMLMDWEESHISSSYEAISDDEAVEDLWEFESGMNDASLILDVMYEQPEIFQLLLFRSTGTPYESFLHEMIEQNTDEMMHYVEECKKHGVTVKAIQRDEMHMLVSAYTSAMLQCIEHGYAKEDARKYLKTIVDFFTPGWRMITGL